jgi:hypothetical protein
MFRMALPVVRVLPVVTAVLKANDPALNVPAVICVGAMLPEIVVAVPRAAQEAAVPLVNKY